VKNSFFVAKKDQNLMVAMLAKLTMPLSGLAMISPIAAIVAACVLFVRHRKRVEPARQVSVIGFILAMVVCGAVGGTFGLLLGIGLACPGMGNLCGLWGFLVTAPIFFALGILLVGIVISMIPARAGPDVP
jgi:hypothetical protein